MSDTPILDEAVVMQVVEQLRDYFRSGQTYPLNWRINQLKALRSMLDEHEHDFAEALRADLGKAWAESKLTEIGFVKGEISYTLKHLKKWLKPKRAAIPLSLQPASGKLVYEPLGTVLIIAPWNYPLMLVLSPLVGALACGNTVLLKPSELSPHVAALISELLPQYVDAQAVKVFEADAEGTAKILTQSFDHIFYTGGAAVAKKVMAAAVQHLTPVTLELGGKSPTWIDDSVDLKHVAQRLAWAKFINAGQTCVAPDYVLTTDDVADRLVPKLIRAVEALYSATPRSCADYGRMINQRHTQRIAALLDDGASAQIVHGGEVDIDERYVAPTIIDRVTVDMKLMSEEIFGPLLPIVRVRDFKAAIDYINSQPKPLALYAFTDDKERRMQLIEQTSSGALGFNLALAHLSAHELPFGGIGMSGQGRYMGKYSIDTFSHLKPIISKPLWPNTMKLIAPPYNRITDLVVKYFVER